MVKWCTSGEGTIKDMGPEVECGRPWTTVDDPWTTLAALAGRSGRPGRPRTTPDDPGRPWTTLSGLEWLFVVVHRKWMTSLV